LKPEDRILLILSGKTGDRTNLISNYLADPLIGIGEIEPIKHRFQKI